VRRAPGALRHEAPGRLPGKDWYGPVFTSSRARRTHTIWQYWHVPAYCPAAQVRSDRVVGRRKKTTRRGSGLGRSRRSRLCRLVRTHAGHRCRRPPQTVGPTSASPGLPFCLLVRSSRTPASASESSGAGHGTEGVGQEEEGIEQARQSGTSGSCPALMEEKAARYHRTVVAETINARGGDVRPGPVLAVVRETRTHQGAA
jgi:hypothetical protein